LILPLKLKPYLIALGEPNSFRGTTLRARRYYAGSDAPNTFVLPRFSCLPFRARLVGRNPEEETEMPDVHISWLAGRTVDQKRKVVEGITKVLMEEAGAKPESTHIVFIDIPHTDFASGGMLVADKNRKT
jgi:4-oxalocrotonate tautomerase